MKKDKQTMQNTERILSVIYDLRRRCAGNKKFELAADEKPQRPFLVRS